MIFFKLIQPWTNAVPHVRSTGNLSSVDNNSVAKHCTVQDYVSNVL